MPVHCSLCSLGCWLRAAAAASLTALLPRPLGGASLLSVAAGIAAAHGASDHLPDDAANALPQVLRGAAQGGARGMQGAALLVRAAAAAAGPAVRRALQDACAVSGAGAKRAGARGRRARRKPWCCLLRVQALPAGSRTGDIPCAPLAGPAGCAARHALPTPNVDLVPL